MSHLSNPFVLDNIFLGLEVVNNFNSCRNVDSFNARNKFSKLIFSSCNHCRYELCYIGEKAVYNGTVAASAQTPELEHEKRQHHNSHVQNGDKNLAERENTVDVFRLSRCKKILPEEIMLTSGIPLRAEDLEVLV